MTNMRLLLVSSLATLAACTVVHDEDQYGSTSQSIVQDNRLAGNRLAGNRLAGNRLAGNRLAGNRLAGNRLSLQSSANDLLSTDDGREVLTYVISCAAPSGTAFIGTDPTTGIEYEFDGEIGLAPQWVDHKLDDIGQRWVSSCLFARVNAFDVAVPVSLRGPSEALAPTDDELANWTLQEGAFYGNWFLPADKPLLWISCRGKDDTTAQDRVCSQPDPANPGRTLCGFYDAGTCAPPPHRLLGGACLFYLPHQTFFDECGLWNPFQVVGSGIDFGPEGDEFLEVITTYIHP